MALEVHYNTALPVYLEPQDGLLATTGTAVLRDEDGATIETLSVTLPTAGSRTVSAGTTIDAIKVSSATGVTVGHKWRVVSDGVTQVFTVARVDGTTVYPLDPLAQLPDKDSAFEPIRMTATISAPGITKIGYNWRLEWLYDDGTTEGFAADVVHVVRWKWNSPISGARIRRHIAHTYPATVDSREAYYWQTIADEANEEIRKLVEATGRRPNLYGSPNCFDRAGYIAAKHLLAGEGIVPAGSNPGIFMEQMRADFDREVSRVISSLKMYDADNDGKISDTEATGLWFSIGTSR
jgi:hypothetical protein